MTTKDLLFEIGTEEIPARFMSKTLENLNFFTQEEFNIARIEHGEIIINCTPRRLVVYVKNVACFQKDIVETSKGPAKSRAFDVNGKATKAAEGFARSMGLQVDELKTDLVNGTEYLIAVTRLSGVETIIVLPEILKKIVKRLSFPKSMYWQDKNISFARPVRWLLSLFGTEIIETSFGDVKSGRISRGHRFMGASEIEIPNAEKYFEIIRENFVIINPEERKQMILRGIEKIENELSAKVEVNTELLNEVVHLNEYPVVFYGSFDKEFLNIPTEVLILTMAKNQRYFPVRDLEGQLMPNFIGVSNNLAKDMSIIKEGNERVLRARLYDAAFFWKEDLKKSLDDMAEELKDITYQEQLGSVYDKVQRVKTLSLTLTKKLDKNNIYSFIERAASIAKADLVSNMVYEFAEVQGVMGREYAKKAGEHKEVCLALYEQYLPRFAGDEIPSSIEGAIIGLADRADTIAAIYKIGHEPTSTQDPYGLRRAARCINEIIWGLSLDIDINELIKSAAAPFNFDSEMLSKIYTFLNLRLQVQLKEKGYSRSVVMLALQTIPTRPLQVARMCDTLQKISDEAWFADLITAAIRIKNLLIKAGDTRIEVDTSKFTSDSEKHLNDQLQYLTKLAKEAIKNLDWQQLVSILAQLAPVITQFFTDVLVMDENLDIRNNRLALLGKCQEFFMHIGDFSLLK